MGEEYNPFNVRLLSVLSYIGPLFIMGRVAVEKEDPEVEFHSRQGGILFVCTSVAYLLTALLCFFLSSLPAIAEILGFLLYVGISVAGLLLSLMGIASAVKKQMRPLPFIQDINKLLQK